ncbi:MAG TPA: DUF4177 domain-containing protein [Luteimonas sp.]|nr:DUF4177 domain-containing protein [Luteimonas sp.]
MANDRWSYQVVEVKPGLLGRNREGAQEKLNQLGVQGWELVAAVRAHRFEPTMLYLKKAA